MKGYTMMSIIIGGLHYVPPAPPPDFSKLEDLNRIIESEAIIYKKERIDALHMKATFLQESNFKADAVSSKGALGCAQLMPGTLKALGLTKEQASDCKTSMQHAFEWMKRGSKEIRSTDPFKLSQWYYCGIDNYGKVIKDKDFGVTEVCGTSYAKGIQEKMKRIKKHEGV